jgi:ankyrin repeat protein
VPSEFVFAASLLAEPGANLFQAVRDGDLTQLKQSLTATDLNFRDRRGATLPMQAAAFGNLETLKLLLDRGADVNAKNDSAATALLWGRPRS